MNQPRYLNDVLKRDGNNFDILRLIAALGVIIGHSYAIAPQPPYQDGVLKFLHFDYSGSLAVKFFFFLSGLLVANSIISKPNPFHFLTKRAFRIFPGLLMCLLVAVFIVGPLFTKLSLGSYFSEKMTWKYLISNFFLTDMVWRLPGVFDESKYGLNGSLWTLPYEVLCYIYLAVLFGLGFLKNRIVSNIFFCLVIGFSFIAPQYLPAFFQQNAEAHLLPACFALGALFANNKSIIRIELSQLVLIWLLVFLSKNSAAYQFLFYVAFFYSAIFFAAQEFVIKKLKLPFDASYGVYVYGFMIQQCLHGMYPAMGVHANQFISSVIAIGMGILSWYLIEKRFIEFGNRMVANNYFVNLQSTVSSYFKPGASVLEPGKPSLFQNSFFVFAILGFVAFIMHAVVLKFVFPGYYSPLYPQHSDFYIPAAFANSTRDTFASLLNWPRPVNMIFAKFFGFFGIHGSIACVIAVVCMNCALSALLIMRILKLRLTPLLALLFALYCFLLFSQPFFYIFYAQDIGAQLSCLFLLLGMHSFYITYKRSVILSNSLLFIFSFIAFMSKETYGLAMLAFALFWFIYYKKTSFLKAALPFATIFAALGIAIALNIAKSPFIDLDAAENSGYRMNLNPFSILKESLKYARDGLNIAHILVLGLIGFLLSKNRDSNRKEYIFIFIGCIVAGIASWVPNALLPNHHYKGYSFNGAYFLYVPVLFLAFLWTQKYLSRFAFAAVAIAILVSPLLNTKKYEENKWVLIQEETQRNLLGALDPLIAKIRSSNEPRKVLIQGITFPFHPFVFPQSLRVFPNAKYVNFDVVNYNPGIANNQQNDLVRFISPSDTALVDYEQKWVFNNDGKLVKSVNLVAEKVFSAPNPESFQINKTNLSQFATTGFYDFEGDISWTNGSSSITLNDSLAIKDSVIIQLNTYMPAICKDVYPELSLMGVDNTQYKSTLTTRKDDVFYYLFILKGENPIKKIVIASQTVDASPDQRTLSFPFMSLGIRKRL